MENISPQNPLSEILKGPDFFFFSLFRTRFVIWMNVMNDIKIIGFGWF